MVQERYASGGGWVGTGSTRVKRHGAFSWRETVHTKKSRYYRACVVRHGLRCSRPVLVRIGKPPKPGSASIALTSWTPTLDAGQSLTAVGSASGNLAGHLAQLQAYDAGTSAWATIGQATIGGDGSVSVSGPVTTAGRAIALRVVSPRSATTGFASSGSFTVTVYGWYYLADLDAVQGSWSSYSGNVNGVAYPYSVSQGVDDFFSSAFGAADLARSCTTFTATIGLADDSSSSASVSAQVAADAATKWQQNGISLGHSYPVALDITGALRLNLSSLHQSGGNARMVFGNAAVRCAFA